MDESHPAAGDFPDFNWFSIYSSIYEFLSTSLGLGTCKDHFCYFHLVFVQVFFLISFGVFFSPTETLKVSISFLFSFVRCNENQMGNHLKKKGSKFTLIWKFVTCRWCVSFSYLDFWGIQEVSQFGRSVEPVWHAMRACYLLQFSNIIWVNKSKWRAHSFTSLFFFKSRIFL